MVYISISSPFSTFGIAQASLALLSLIEKILFSSVVYIQYTPSSKRNLYSKIIDKSEAVYFFHVSFRKGAKKLLRNYYGTVMFLNSSCRRVLAEDVEILHQGAYSLESLAVAGTGKEADVDVEEVLPFLTGDGERLDSCQIHVIE